MRELIRDFVELACETLPLNGPVYEFGSFLVPGQEQLADLRPLFPGKQYVGADMREGPGVDMILNLHDVALPDATAGTVLCLDTLEHVEYPHRAVQEIHRILKPEGIAVLTSVMDFPIHDYPYDYWRFTPEAFRSLLKPFAHCFVGYVGVKKFPHTVVGIGFKGAPPSLAEFERRFAALQERYFVEKTMTTLKWLRKMITPPLLSGSARKKLGLVRRRSK